MECLLSSKRTKNTDSQEEDSDDDIEFIGESTSRPILEYIDLLSSSEEDCSGSSKENVKRKDHIDYQKEKVASTLDRLARHVEVEKQLKEEKNKAFKPGTYRSLMAVPSLTIGSGICEAPQTGRQSQPSVAYRYTNTWSSMSSPHGSLHKSQAKKAQKRRSQASMSNSPTTKKRHISVPSTGQTKTSREYHQRSANLGEHPSTSASQSQMFSEVLSIIIRLLQFKQTNPNTQSDSLPHSGSTTLNRKQKEKHQFQHSSSASHLNLERDFPLGHQDNSVSEKEGGEWSDSDSDQPGSSDRLFRADDFPALLAKVKDVLGLASQRPELAPKEMNTRTQGNEIPFPSALLNIIRSEWAAPGSSKKGLGTANKLYSFSPQIMEVLKVPSVDPSVVSMISGASMPKPGEGSLRDPDDRRIDKALKRAHESAALVIRASVAGSVFSRAALIWVEDLLRKEEISRRTLRRTLTKILKCLQFVADAATDSVRFAARAISNITVARRSTWLRHCQLDAQTKATLATAPFKGTMLFGEEALKSVLVETKDKKLAMPVTKSQDKRPFQRNSQHSSFRPSRGSYKSGESRYNRPQWARSNFLIKWKEMGGKAERK